MRGGVRRKTESGVLSMDDGSVALWHGAVGVCHVLVASLDINVDLGLNFLAVFAAVLADHCKGGALETFQVKPDEAMVLLDKFLPSGELLVLNVHLIKELKKNADQIILQKL